jgi:predicted AlkP superfamily phosphohydrolase/phosphomutase
MLTGRWWLGYIDPTSQRYNQVSPDQRSRLWQEVHQLYRQLDDILGTLLRRADKHTVVALTSDHGAIPLDQSVRLNNLFAQAGLLQFNPNPKTGVLQVDWKHTKAVYLKMHAVYLHPDGLAGPWRRGTGPDYEALRSRVKRLLQELTDAHGVHPLEKVIEWENAAQTFRLDPERTGDLIIANRAGFGWSEALTEDLQIFSVPLKTGYKQAVIADRNPGMWTPFLFVGPSIPKDRYWGDQPIEMVDVYPTLLQAMKVPCPDWVQGRNILDTNYHE